MKNLREKSRRISGKINAFRKIISERHLIWNAVLVNFRTLCNCYIIPEKVGVGSVIPRSVPANFAVKPDKK